jgi:hypothetical protein
MNLMALSIPRPYSDEWYEWWKMNEKVLKGSGLVRSRYYPTSAWWG